MNPITAINPIFWLWHTRPLSKFKVSYYPHPTMPSPLIPRPDVDEESASSSQDDESMSVSPTDGFVVAAGPGPSGDTRSKSLATRIKALSVAKPPAKHPMSFLLGMFAIFCVCIPATICFIFLILLALALIGIPIAEVVIGSLYLDAKFCSEHSIPILLIVGGCVALAGILVDVGCRCKFEGGWWVIVDNLSTCALT